MGRSNNCYICGKVVTPDAVVSEMFLDRKDRLVHSLCKKRMLRAQEEIKISDVSKIIINPDETINTYLARKMGISNKIDLFTWKGFGILWDWSHKKDWHLKFREKTMGYSRNHMVAESRVNPSMYARDIAKYLKNQDTLDAIAADRLPGHP